MTLRIEYMTLEELAERFHPSNPKDHAVSSIAASFSTLNYREPVMLDERSGLLAAGHGRIKALVSMQQQQMEKPEGIQENGDGAWLVPVVCGSEFTPEQLRAYLVASNNLTIEGGWNEPALAELLQELAATDTALLESVGFDGDKLDELLRDLMFDASELNNNFAEEVAAQMGDRSVQITFVFEVEKGAVMLNWLKQSGKPSVQEAIVELAKRNVNAR